MRIRLTSPLYLSDIANTLRCEYSGNDRLIYYICTDTRETYAGDIFIGIKGKSFDGADFTDEAHAKGALVISERKNADICVDSVNDALLILIGLFKVRLKRLKYTVAITGSVGKTSTKEMVGALLSERYKTHSTKENFNNLVGLFHTVLSAPDDTEALICELGMNHKGEISMLSSAINPDIAIITNIGTAHIGNLGSREAIAAEKLSVCDGMDDGICIVPFDEPLLASAKNKYTVSVGNQGADLCVIPLRESAKGTDFDAYTKSRAFLSKKLFIPGRHMLTSFSYALVASLLLDINDEELDTALTKIDEGILRPKFRTIGKFTVYDDTYSASPEATVEVIKMLKLYKKPICAVLGDMLELGRKSASLHRGLGKCAARLDCKRLYLIGTYAADIAEGAIKGGMKKENIHINKDVSRLDITAEAIKKKYKGEILLIKGSHALHLEKLTKLLEE